MVFRRLINNPRFQEEVENQLREPGENNDIHSGLIPIGDTGLDRTPDEPAAPTDCARYPDSPFCGGIPFTLTPIGLDPEIINDGCNIGIRLNPAIAFIRLPPVALVYRKPECRDQRAPNIQPDLESPELPFNCGTYATVTIGGSSVYDKYFSTHAIVSAKKIPGIYVGLEGYLYEDWLVYYKNVGNTTQQLWNTYTYQNEPKTDYFLGRYSGKYLDETGLLEGRIIPIKDSQRNYSLGTEGKVLTVYRGNLPYYLIENRCPFNVLPPSPPKEICCMPQCCPPPDNDLLKVLIKKVNKLSEAIGVDELPAALPKRIIYPNGKGEEKPKNIVEILGYQVKQIDRAVGLLPQKIKVADTNPGLAGNQSVEVEIHSFADFAKEILQLLLDTEGDVDTTNNMLVRVLYELGFIHQGVVQGDAMLDAIVEFLDFKQKWKKISIPFAFDPHAGTKGKVGQGFDKQKTIPAKALRQKKK